MSWEDSLHLLPTRNQALLAALVGHKIVRLTHHAERPDELLASDPYVAQQIRPSQLFSVANGPAVVSVDGAPAICIADAAELMSVTIELADEPSLRADWPASIDANDTIYSEPRFARLVGTRILSIRVLQRVVFPDRLIETTGRGIRAMSPGVLDRAREAVVIFDLESERQLIFARELIQAPDDFAVLTESDPNDQYASQYREVLRLGMQRSQPST
jgi:hypothetical protein